MAFISTNRGALVVSDLAASKDRGCFTMSVRISRVLIPEAAPKLPSAIAFSVTRWRAILAPWKPQVELVESHGGGKVLWINDFNMRATARVLSALSRGH